MLDPRVVWNSFGGRVISYYYFLTHPQDRITEWRKEFDDPMVFAEFEWLDREIGRLDVKLSGPHAFQTRFEESQGVFRDEVALAIPG